MKKRIVVAVLLVIAVFTALLLFALPNPLFDRPSSIVLYDRDGELLGARIADDEQWRFPVSKEIEPRFERCILLKEDRFFRLHPGLIPYHCSVHCIGM